MAHSAPARRRILPRWLSWPVAVAAPVVLLLVGLEVASASVPPAVVLALVPLAVVAPVLVWVDRVHPQAWPTRVHALLWGSTVAVAVTAVVNTSAEEALGASVVAVAVAPLVEETMKGLGVVWAVRRGEVDGAMDGILTAGWVGLGFAVVEDMLYFAGTEQDGELLQEFLLRAVLSPFAHPMLTFWTGLAVGIAVYRRRPLVWAWWGFVVAVGWHVLLNGTWEVADEAFPPLGVALMLVLIAAAVTVALKVRRQDVARFVDGAPAVVERYGPSSWDSQQVSDWSGVLAHRRQLPRQQRRRFDRQRGAVARLALQQSRPGGPDPDREHELVVQLSEHADGAAA